MVATPFTYTGNQQIFRAKYRGYYTIECWGAQGGNATNSVNGQGHGTATGGKGGYTKGKIFLEKDETIYIYVGEKGKDGASNYDPPGSYNGGGPGRSHGGASGGGGTDVRRGGTSLNHRIMVAGGGGGSVTMGTNFSAIGGYGGGLVGGFGEGNGWGWDNRQYVTNGGSQTGGGGTNHWNNSTAYTGGLGIGGNAYSSYIGGGGGGYYGGASGYIHGSSGGGGSSYIDQSLFSKIENKAGNVLVPNPHIGGNEVGNTGNGYVRITFISGAFEHYAIKSEGEIYIPSRINYNTETKQYNRSVIDINLNIDIVPYNSFVTKINELFLETTIDGETFVPILKFKNPRIVKMRTMSDIYKNNNDFNEGIISSMRIDHTNIDMADIKIKDEIFLEPTQYCYVCEFNTSKAKMNIETKEGLFGEYFKEIDLNETRACGFINKHIKSYDLNMPSLKIGLSFIQKITLKADKLKKVTIYKKIKEKMELISTSDYTVHHNLDRDIVTVKFNKQYKEVVVNKTDNSVKEIPRTLEEFY